jgi:hypothetical protein
MNDASASDLAEHRFAEAVKNYVPKVSAKWKKLLSLKEGITELRRKRASYRTIAEILRNMDVPVSHVTVGRFCRHVSKSMPRRVQPRKATVKPMSHKAHSQPQIHNTGNRAVQPSNEPRGARVADPNTI